MSEIIVVLDNIRSIYNVGNILRTADGLGIKRVMTVGVTPHPKQPNDERLPHVIMRAESQLAKTALGAESTVKVMHFADTSVAIKYLRQNEYSIIALEQTAKSEELRNYKNVHKKLAIILGNEKTGLSEDFLVAAESVYEIKMRGKKNSFNVSVAAAIAMYQIATVDKSD